MNRKQEAQPDNRDRDRPDSPTALVESSKWVRVLFGGEVIADSKRVLLLREKGQTPVYYFPRSDIQMQYLSPVNASDADEATLWTVKVNAAEAGRAAWDYARVGAADDELAGYITFKWEAMDAWFEEDEEIYVHPRDPYTRVDVLPSSRHIRVEIGGETVAESNRPVLLFETGLPTRYYLPKVDVRLDLLEPSDRHTRCPYKGTASYYHVRAGEDLVEDIVWYYPFPTPEVAPIKNTLSFYSERLTDFYIDGERLNESEAP